MPGNKQMLTEEVELLELMRTDRLVLNKRNAKRWAYSDTPSEASHSVIVAICFPRSSTAEHGTTTMQSNHDHGLCLRDPG